MIFKLKTFDQLSNHQLYSMMQLRSEVFVVEQNCAYQDLDGKDESSLHLLGIDNDELVAYARILPPGISYKEAAIGRVVVSPRYRGKKYGVDLMKQAIQDCSNMLRANEIVISAQQYLEKFYNDLGFATESEMYLEDNIPHIKMRWKK